MAAQARADRGPLVAGWCASMLVRLWVRELRGAPELGARLRAGWRERQATPTVPPGR